jgi:hypothetical protein
LKEWILEFYFGHKGGKDREYAGIWSEVRNELSIGNGKDEWGVKRLLDIDKVLTNQEVSLLDKKA